MKVKWILSLLVAASLSAPAYAHNGETHGGTTEPDVAPVEEALPIEGLTKASHKVEQAAKALHELLHGNADGTSLTSKAHALSETVGHLHKLLHDSGETLVAEHIVAGRHVAGGNRT